MEREVKAISGKILKVADLGIKTLDELVGRTDLLEQKNVAKSGSLCALPAGRAHFLVVEHHPDVAAARFLTTPLQETSYWETLPEGQLELIVSNPPYLTAAEMEQLQPEVAQEPAMAVCRARSCAWPAGGCGGRDR